MTGVLVVEDEPQLLRALSIHLRALHYEVRGAASGGEALRLASACLPDLVILDLGLPDMDGTEVIAGLRGWTDVPILVLSGRTDSADKVDALDAGADDYVTKPFGMAELVARLRAMTRRSGTKDKQADVQVGEASVDLAARKVTLAGSRGPPHTHRVAPAGGATAAPRQAAQPARAALRGLGPRLRDGSRQPASLHGTAPPQARARPSPAAAPAQRTRHGLPLRALAE